LRSKIEVIELEIGYLLDPCSSVVKHQDEGAISKGVTSLARHAFQQGDDLVPFEELSLVRRDPFDGDGHSLLGRIQGLGHPGGEVGEEAPQRCQALIASPGVIAAVLLQVLQEGKNTAHTQVFHVKTRDGPVSISGYEVQEEPHSIAIAPDRCGPEPLLNGQMVFKERAHCLSECRFHDAKPSASRGWA